MIALACDHGALDLKLAVKRHLEEKGIACQILAPTPPIAATIRILAQQRPGPSPAARVKRALSFARRASASASRPIRSRESAARCCRT